MADFTLVRCLGDGQEQHVVIRVPEHLWSLDYGKACMVSVIRNDTVDRDDESKNAENPPTPL